MSVFLKAIEILKEKGWTKGAYSRLEPNETTRYGLQPAGYCLVGACAEAAFPFVNDINDKISAFENENNGLHSILTRACTGRSPTRYNDELLNKDEAIEILRKAYEHECELAKQTEHSFALPA